MNILTIVVLVVFLVFMGLGFGRGLLKSVFKIAMTGLALLLAYLLSPIISSVIIEHTTIDNTIRNKIYAVVENAVEEKIKEEINQTMGNVDSTITNQLVELELEEEPNRNSQIEFIQNMELPDFLQKALIDNNNSEMKQDMGVTSFYDYISTYLARMLVNAIGFFVTFLFLNLLFSVTLLLMNMVMKLPGLNAINRFAGAALGFAEALIIVWVLFILIDVAVGTGVGAGLMEQINESKLLSLIYDKNLIAGFIQEMIQDI
ncbi:MAG: CvpA family protein [Lachnospiraceae bacterium]|nr:CvpA family protein [Lachnospiraceae bacterium]MBR3599389.1 CvpA family protein [Lachnospiraceae bacterium]